MSVIAKVMGRVMIMRIYNGIDSHLRKEQAGHRKGRSTIEQTLVTGTLFRRH